MRLGIFGLVYAALIVLILIGWALSRQGSQDSVELTGTQLGAQVDFTSTPTATVNSGSTPLPTLAATATFMPVPSLEIQGTQEIIEYLYITNHGCDFPCWWGIVPGETKWGAAEAFLRPLAVEFQQHDDLVYLEDGSLEHHIVVPVPETLDADGLGSITIVEDWWGFVRTVSMTTNFAAMGYGFEDMLARYGPPAGILVSARGRDPATLEDFGVFLIGLYYENDGIMMVYFGIIESGTRRDEGLEICLSGMVEEFSWLLLWDPANRLPDGMLVSMGMLSSDAMSLSPLGEISELTADGFLDQAVSSEGQDFCFEIVNTDHSQ